MARPMSTFKSSLFVVLVFFLYMAGCAKTQQFEPVEQICIEGLDKSTARQTAEEVLERMYFTIDKSDAEQGYIRTKPLRAAQLFEFWRKDNVGGFNTAEANLHNIRRMAELNISKKNGQVCIDCYVKCERLSLPERRVSSSAQAYAMFTKSRKSLQRMELTDEQVGAMVWIDLGRDAKLETEVLKRIRSKVASQ
jgi:hypothetical protein